MADAGWNADPTGRFAQRYWDGTGWTEHVSDASGTQSTDAVAAAPVVASVATVQAPAAGGPQYTSAPMVQSPGNAYQPGLTYGTAPVHGTVTKQGAWGLWWLCGLTLGIYFLVWYQRINRELAALNNTQAPADGQWWAMFIPIFGLMGLARTAKRINAAHAMVGSPTRVSSVVAWLWAPLWFSSHTRYLQRRMNVLHDVLASKAFHAG